jgi:hypothetical protein
MEAQEEVDVDMRDARDEEPARSQTTAQTTSWEGVQSSLIEPAAAPIFICLPYLYSHM